MYIGLELFTNKKILWDPVKNEKLKALRGISFEDVLGLIEAGCILDVVPSEKRNYLHQKHLIISVLDYTYFVPFVEDEHHIFLKTIIPSRKLHAKYKSRLQIR
jgi:uncharacterized DUF497 family protein